MYFNSFMPKSLLDDSVVDLEHVERCCPLDNASIDYELELEDVNVLSEDEVNVAKVLKETMWTI